MSVAIHTCEDDFSPCQCKFRLKPHVGRTLVDLGMASFKRRRNINGRIFIDRSAVVLKPEYHAATLYGIRLQRANREYLLRVRSAVERSKQKYGSSSETPAGICEICGRPIYRGLLFYLPERLCNDHDHATGEWRGELCDFCNKGLGYFRDDVEALRKAIEYLQERKKTNGPP